MLAHIHKWTHTPAQSVATSFPLCCASKAVLLLYVDFIIECVIKAGSEPASAALETQAGIKGPLCGWSWAAHRPPDVYLNVQNMLCRSCNLLALV